MASSSPCSLTVQLVKCGKRQVEGNVSVGAVSFRANDKNKDQGSMLDVKQLTGFENNKILRVICHQLPWILKNQEVCPWQCRKWLSFPANPKVHTLCLCLKEAARYWVVKHASWEIYSDYPSGVFGTLLDGPRKMTRWDSISLLKLSIRCWLKLTSFTKLPGTCPLCRSLM